MGEFKLSLPARSENLGTVRRALSDFAASLGVDDETILDLRLAVHEACSNVVRHAYGEDIGAMKVEARPVGASLVVVVEDEGQGLAHASSDPGAGLGLRVASAVSDSLEVRQKKRAGTEVRLAFPLGQVA